MKKKFLFLILILVIFSWFFLTNYSTRAKEVCLTCPQWIIRPITWQTRLTLGAVIGGAVVDAINPCEFAILILLMASILLMTNRQRALFSGLSFILAIFIAYFLMGLGLLKAIQNLNLNILLFKKIIGSLAVIIGLLNIKDYFWYGKGILMEIPLSWRPKMKSLIRSVSGPIGAFLVGLLVSLFLLPCTSGPYLVILGLLTTKVSQIKALFYLILYNLIFILPMLFIVFLIYFGLEATQAEKWRQEKIRLLHLITGLIMISLGMVILVGWI